MKHASKFILLVSSVALLACTTANGGNKSPESDHFEGHDIEVKIDGRTTEKTEELRITDSDGTAGRTTNWRAATASKEGKPCFEYSIKNPAYLGPIKESDVHIVEIRFDREQYRWRTFKTNPDPRNTPPYPSMLLKPGEKYCPSEYFLTDRLRFPRLPAGDYYVGVRVGGTQSWDRQDILLRVE